MQEAERTPLSKNRFVQSFVLVFASVWIYTFMNNTDMANWWIENTLTILFLVFIVTTYKKYRFSDLSYFFMCVFVCMHVYGSMCTYASNPLGFWLQDLLQTERNHYDRIVHFSFGFVLAYPFRELFGNWLKFPSYSIAYMPIVVALAVSSLYEMIEWAVADVFFKAQGPAYLGTQGDVWDAQKDSFLAFAGAVLGTIIISMAMKKAKNNVY